MLLGLVQENLKLAALLIGEPAHGRSETLTPHLLLHVQDFMTDHETSRWSRKPIVRMDMGLARS